MVAIVIAKIILKRKYTFLYFLRKLVIKDEQSRWRIWIDFCRRKNFVPSKYTGLCSKHFRNDSYILSHSPEFLSSLNFVGKPKLLLKPDAVPTVNAALDKKGHASEPKKRQRGTLSRKRYVRMIQCKTT